MLSLTLAAGWEEVIGVSIALVIFIGNMLAKGLKKTNEQSQQSSAKPKRYETQQLQGRPPGAALLHASLFP